MSPSTNPEWIAAKKRAKFMQKILLQDKDNFDNVVIALREPDVQQRMLSFIHACSIAGLVPAETNWLWNYLKEYNMVALHAAPEHPGETLASSGW